MIGTSVFPAQAGIHPFLNIEIWTPPSRGRRNQCRLKRVFGIEIAQCARCGGRLKVIASIEEPDLIERILAHRRKQGGEEAMTASLGARAPPQASLL